ncbi:MAG: SMP-30/gluconolactonase/LRE family protein [Pseudomonadota bacterium]
MKSAAGQPNPLHGWQVDRAAIRTIGHDLQRPECILAEPDGSLWVADARGGVMHIAGDGSQELIVPAVDQHFGNAGSAHEQFMYGTLPNGLAFAANGDLLISNFGTDVLEVMTRSGERRTLYDTIDGKPIGKVNFVLRDSQDRIWITISTRVNPWSNAIRADLADGYIALVDGAGIRVVAEGFAFTNEIRLDAKEEWLYIAETTGKRISRMRVQPDGALTDREVYGPASLGAGFPDGFAFDSFGNLWVTMIMSDRLLAITPEGEVLTLLDDGNPAGTAALESCFASGASVPTEILVNARGTLAPWMASVTFGGKDLKTVYLGSLMGHTIPFFRAPVAGLPMVHWK